MWSDLAAIGIFVGIMAAIIGGFVVFVNFVSKKGEGTGTSNAPEAPKSTQEDESPTRAG